MGRMTARQKRFCDEYLIDLNATQAAIRAGYSPKTAYRTGADNLIKPQIKNYLTQRMAEKEKALVASQDEVLGYLTAVLRGEEAEEVVVMEGLGMGESRAKKVDKGISAKDRIRAAELLGKRLGVFDGDAARHNDVEDLTPLARMLNADTDSDD